MIFSEFEYLKKLLAKTIKNGIKDQQQINSVCSYLIPYVCLNSLHSSHKPSVNPRLSED